MGGRGASSIATGRGGFQVGQTPPIIQPTLQAQQQANGRTFDDTDSRDFHDLKGGRNYFQSQNMTIDQQIATMNYLEPNPEKGSLYSMSQNLNYALANGQPLNANQKYVYNNLMGSMHNLGENLNLTRYDHQAGVDNLLKQAGYKGSYDSLSETQLKKLLVGQTYKENKFVSTSTNNFANAGSSAQTFTSRPIKYTYKTKANVQAYMPGNGPGGALGEMVLAPSGSKANYKIVDVKYTGQKARKKGTQSYTLPQVEIVVEVDKQ